MKIENAKRVRALLHYLQQYEEALGAPTGNPIVSVQVQSGGNNLFYCADAGQPLYDLAVSVIIKERDKIIAELETL